MYQAITNVITTLHLSGLLPRREASGARQHAGSPRRPRALALVGSFLLVTLGAAMSLVGVAAPAGATSVSISGSAYGVDADVTLPLTGPVSVGPVPQVTLPSDGTAQSASVASVNVATLLSTGASTVTTSGTPASGEVTSSSSVNGMNLAGGAVTAGPIQSDCSVGAAGPQATASVTDFRIGGVSQTLTGTNVTVNLPGLGYLVYNEQTTSSGGGVESATVNALHIHLTVASVATGEIVIGHADCAGPVVAAPSPAPTVSTVSPSTCSTTGGTTVILTGTGLTGATDVSFGGTSATIFTVVDDSTITATTPAHAAGVVDVTVTTPGGTSAGAGFTYQAPVVIPDPDPIVPDPDPIVVPLPVVLDVSPATGSTAGGTSVTLTGTGLTGATAVSFGGAAATFTVVDDTTIEVTTPAHDAGLVAVTVTTPGGISAATAFLYEAPVVVPDPIVPDPVVVPVPDPVVVPDPVIPVPDPVVPEPIVAPTPAPIPAPTPVPAPTPEPTPVLPVVSGISPATGPAAGGTTVTLTGTGFTGTTEVSFGGVAAEFRVVDDATIEVTVPAHDAGLVAVTVTTAEGTSAAAAFTYEDDTVAAPLGQQVTPSDGASQSTESSDPAARAASPADSQGSGNAARPRRLVQSSTLGPFDLADFMRNDKRVMWGSIVVALLLGLFWLASRRREREIERRYEEEDEEERHAASRA